MGKCQVSQGVGHAQQLAFCKRHGGPTIVKEALSHFHAIRQHAESIGTCKEQQATVPKADSSNAFGRSIQHNDDVSQSNIHGVPSLHVNLPTTRNLIRLHMQVLIDHRKGFPNFCEAETGLRKPRRGDVARWQRPRCSWRCPRGRRASLSVTTGGSKAAPAVCGLMFLGWLVFQEPNDGTPLFGALKLAPTRGGEMMGSPSLEPSNC